MDTTRDVLYRGFLLNDSSIRSRIDPDRGVGKGISGCVIDTWDFSEVEVVQYAQKRAQQDGIDVGNPMLGARRLKITGTLYGKTRPQLYDGYWQLRAALHPVLAYQDSPADHGYQPLYFSTPTNNIDSTIVPNSAGKTRGYPNGVIALRTLVMPRSLQVAWQRNLHGGPDWDALALPWQASLIAKDPNIYSELPSDYPITGSGSGSFVNRGTYYATLNALIVVGTSAGTISIQAGGATNFTITVPAAGSQRIIRIKGQDRIITFETSGTEVLAMNSVPTGMTWPKIPPGVSPYTITFTGGVAPLSGSHMWFWEVYA